MGQDQEATSTKLTWVLSYLVDKLADTQQVAQVCKVQFKQKNVGFAVYWPAHQVILETGVHKGVCHQVQRTGFSHSRDTTVLDHNSVCSVYHSFSFFYGRWIKKQPRPN
ncbi:uncharacterized protein LOC144007383 isoform X2 [Festucalex cinctus]